LSASGKSYGVLAEFDSPAAIHKAAGLVRAANYSKWDTHTPFPVHGLDRAMGLPRPKLAFAVFAFGIGGAASAMLLQWWTSAVDYKLIIAAKPFFSWQAFVPICFEVMVLASAACAVFGMLFMNRLPQWYHPLLKMPAFAGATDDRFFLSIEQADPKFDAKATTDFLFSIGASRVDLVEE
jgi:hypothetical protein